MPYILFVCSGNICRSPMAEGILRKMLEEKGLSENFQTGSAGTLPLSPSPASDNSVTVMASQGIDISRHRSRPVNLPLLGKSDLILTMEAEHCRFLEETAPYLSRRVYQLSEMTGVLADVDDPIGLDIAAYWLAAADIRMYLEKGFEQIISLAQNSAGVWENSSRTG